MAEINDKNWRYRIGGNLYLVHKIDSGCMLKVVGVNPKNNGFAKALSIAVLGALTLGGYNAMDNGTSDILTNYGRTDVVLECFEKPSLGKLAGKYVKSTLDQLTFGHAVNLIDSDLEAELK